MCTAHLLVEEVLHKVPECHFLVELGARIAHCGTLTVLKGVVVGPLAECGCAVEVAIVAECGIGHEPVFVGIEKFLVLAALEHGGSFLVVEQLQVFALGVVHALVVDLRQGVQLLAQLLKLCCLERVLQRWQLVEVDVLRVQCIDADAVVGVGVLPCPGDGGVVDGQHLQGALAGGGHPVDHALEVAKVAHAEALLATQREDGNHGAGELHGVERERGLSELVGHHVAFAHGCHTDGAVVAVFPHRGCIVVVRGNGKLKFQELRVELFGIEYCHPLVVVVLGHGDGLHGIPIA